MYPTMEARWFFEGAIPPGLRHWFQQQTSQPTLPSSRTDYYLRLQDDSLGIKLREGRIEVKQRHRRLGPISLHPRVTGLVGHWRKWSFPLDQAGTNLSGLATPVAAWIGVQKRRRLLRYQITSDKQLLPAPSGREPEQGCEIELGQIRVGDQDWWSLCFELFGSEAGLEELFLWATEQLLRGADPPLLKVESSYSYPAWLANIPRRK